MHTTLHLSFNNKLPNVSVLLVVLHINLILSIIIILESLLLVLKFAIVYIYSFGNLIFELRTTVLKVRQRLTFVVTVIFKLLFSHIPLRELLSCSVLNASYVRRANARTSLIFRKELPYALILKVKLLTIDFCRLFLHTFLIENTFVY